MKVSQETKDHLPTSLNSIKMWLQPQPAAVYLWFMLSHNLGSPA